MPRAQLQPSNTKALHRRALALRSLDRLDEAMDAYRCAARTAAALLPHPALSNCVPSGGRVRVRFAPSASLIGPTPRCVASRVRACRALRAALPNLSLQVQDEINDLASCIAQRDGLAAPRPASMPPTPAPTPVPTPAPPAPPAPKPPAAPPPAAAAAAPPPRRHKIPITQQEEEDDDAAEVSAADVTFQLAPEPAPAAAPAAAASSSAPPPQQVDEEAERRAQAEADRHREAGNQFYKQAKYGFALQAYQQSLAARESAAAHCNAALVYLRLQQPGDAERSCRAALALEPHYTKAVHRLGKALRAQGRPLEALPLLEQVAAEVAVDAELAKELAAVRQEAAAAASQQPPPPQQQQQPVTRHKIRIEDTQSDGSEDDDDEEEEEEEEQQQQQQRANGGGAAAAARSGGSGGGGGVHAAAAAKAAAALASLASKRPLPPKSAVDFSNACKQLQADPAALADYVRSVAPSGYAALFKQSLDNTGVSHLVRALAHVSKVRLLGAAALGSGAAARGGRGTVTWRRALRGAQEDAAFAREALLSLAAVPRFSMVVSMIPAADKATLRQVVADVERAGLDAQAVRDKYKV